MGPEESEYLILQEEESGRQEFSLQFRQNISYVYSGVHLEDSVIILKCLLELKKSTIILQMYSCVISTILLYI